MFKSYVKLRNLIRSKLEIKKDATFLTDFVTNAARLLVPISILVSFGLAILFVRFDLLVLGTLSAIVGSGIIYGIDGRKVYLDELFYAIGIPIAALNGFTAFIKFLLYSRPNNPMGELSTVITALVFFLIGVVLLMTASSRPHTEIKA